MEVKPSERLEATSKRTFEGIPSTLSSYSLQKELNPTLTLER